MTDLDVDTPLRRVGEVAKAHLSPEEVSATVATIDDVTYLTRKRCPSCDTRAQRMTEVVRDGITYGYYLCPRGHSWEMHWREP